MTRRPISRRTLLGIAVATLIVMFGGFVLGFYFRQQSDSTAARRANARHIAEVAAQNRVIQHNYDVLCATAHANREALHDIVANAIRQAKAFDPSIIADPALRAAVIRSNRESLRVLNDDLTAIARPIPCDTRSTP